MANSARNKPGESRVIESNTLDNVQVFYEKNKKGINTTITVILLVVVGYFAYTKLYKAPREEKAATAVSYAQHYMMADSLNLALNGDGQHLGFLKVIKKYDGTDIANMCHYYAGVCYMNMGDFSNALKQLKDFNGKGTVLEYEAYGLMGDAYLETGKLKDAIDYYNKAAANKDDQMLTPIYLQRAGIAYEDNHQPEEAKKMFKRVIDEYPRSLPARDMDKELARLGDLNQP